MVTQVVQNKCTILDACGMYQPTLILWELDGRCLPNVDLFCRCYFTHQSAFHGANKNELLLFSSQESQKQVQELLNDSSGAEMSRLKIQLQQSIASKSVTEQLCETLQVWNDYHAD